MLRTGTGTAKEGMGAAKEGMGCGDGIANASVKYLPLPTLHLGASQCAYESSCRIATSPPP